MINYSCHVTPNEFTPVQLAAFWRFPRNNSKQRSKREQIGQFMNDAPCSIEKKVQEGTGQNYLARTHGNGYVTDKPRMMMMMMCRAYNDFVVQSTPDGCTVHVLCAMCRRRVTQVTDVTSHYVIITSLWQHPLTSSDSCLPCLWMNGFGGIAVVGPLLEPQNRPTDFESYELVADISLTAPCPRP